MYQVLWFEIKAETSMSIQLNKGGSWLATLVKSVHVDIEQESSKQVESKGDEHRTGLITSLETCHQLDGGRDSGQHADHQRYTEVFAKYSYKNHQEVRMIVRIWFKFSLPMSETKLTVALTPRAV